VVVLRCSVVSCGFQADTHWLGYWTFPRHYRTVNSGVKSPIWYNMLWSHMLWLHSIHCCSLYLCHHRKSLVQFAELHLSTVVNFSSANLANESVTFERLWTSVGQGNYVWDGVSARIPMGIRNFGVVPHCNALDYSKRRSIKGPVRANIQKTTKDVKINEIYRY